MTWKLALLLPLAFAAAGQTPEAVVPAVRAAIAQHDLDAGERAARAYGQRHGATPEMAEALSWLGRGWLAEKKWDRAETFAMEARKMALELLKSRPLDAERRLSIALGASIEVRAQALAARGARAEAVAFLQEELRRWGNTSLHERIQKNIHLLSLEGKRAPELDLTQWAGPRRVTAASLRGKTVLLFFWAHWCSDCKNEAPILADLARAYRPRGLMLVNPTRLYGYAARGETASPGDEMAYITSVWQKNYSGLQDFGVPLSTGNFQTYGSSTTPTLVLIDAKGIVRMYHPGSMPETELAARVAALLSR